MATMNACTTFVAKMVAPAAAPTAPADGGEAAQFPKRRLSLPPPLTPLKTTPAPTAVTEAAPNVTTTAAVAVAAVDPKVTAAAAAPAEDYAAKLGRPPPPTLPAAVR